MTFTRPSVVVVLAAGEGTRMKSAVPKVLHKVAGRTMIGHVIEAASGIEPEQVVVVVGHGREQVSEHVTEIAPWALIVVQEEQRGTGHAVRTALAGLASSGAAAGDGPVVVLSGDTPLLQTATLVALLGAHGAADARATVLTARAADPTGYGRIVRTPQGDLAEIVEEPDASPEQRQIDEINGGIYAFDGASLVDALGRISSDNSQGEEYLTDVIGLLRADAVPVAASLCPDPADVMGVNDRAQLAEVAAIMRDRINLRWMRDGVTMVDPSTTWIDVDVDIATDVTLRPLVTLRGPTSLGEGAVIGPGTTLTSCEVGERAEVIHTWAELAVVGPDARVGPFTFLRPGTVLGASSRAGAYVEIKNSIVGEGSKVPHLSYVGDAEIGAGSNIGAATVFVNYDGVEKHRTTVGDHVRIGSDTMLVAPVTVGDGAYTAAGSVITDDVPPGAMAVGRARQRNVAGWVERRRPGSPSAEAAARANQSESAPETDTDPPS